jgi:hypothetical protein
VKSSLASHLPCEDFFLEPSASVVPVTVTREKFPKISTYSLAAFINGYFFGAKVS